MARKYNKTGPQLMADKIDRQRRQIMKDRKGIFYCPKCDYGWYLHEGTKCPNCGYEVKEES